jgi:hypothetical protein
MTRVTDYTERLQREADLSEARDIQEITPLIEPRTRFTPMLHQQPDPRNARDAYAIPL